MDFQIFHRITMPPQLRRYLHVASSYMTVRYRLVPIWQVTKYSLKVPWPLIFAVTAICGVSESRSDSSIPGAAR